MKIGIRKNRICRVAAFLLALVTAFSFSACGKKKTSDAVLWETALYQTDTEMGEGEKTLSVTVKAGEKSVTFTVHTNQKTVGSALQEQNLVTGEQGPYGLYVKSVNGIPADYDADQTYWAFSIDGETAVTGVDSTEITEGTEYQLVRTK